MKYYIISTPLAVFAFNENTDIEHSIWYKDTEEDRLEAFNASKSMQLSKYESDMIKHITKKDKTAKIIFENMKDTYESEFPNIGGTTLRQNLRNIINGSVKFKNITEYYNSILNVTLLLTKKKISESVTNDKLIIQATNAIEDLEEAANILSVRLREWYGFLNPELSQKIHQHEAFVNAIIDKQDEKTLMGAELDQADKDKIEQFANSLKKIYEEKQNLENYIEKKIREVLPNATSLINPTLTARLLATAGSLSKLARFPSSTIQVIGAEKALFRHIRGQGTSPKHGLIFQSPFVNQAKRDVRGKVARMLASKLSIAFKVDYFKGNFIGDTLKEDFENKIKNINIKSKNKSEKKHKKH
ncbi:MAG: hypothetical protein K0B02_04990 [DPANN group archaeon]|nr:hypothetical protein [DPANN group archaeon]